MHPSYSRVLAALALCGVLTVPLPGVAAPTILLGVALPQSGIDGAAALQQREAIRMAADDLRARGTNVQLRAPDLRSSAVRNPHQDEGTDNGADLRMVPRLINALYKANVVAVLGPMRANVAAAMIPRLTQLHIAAVSATATGPSPADTPLFRLTPSDRQLAAEAYARMKEAYGPRVCVLDDGTNLGRTRAHAFMKVAPQAHHATVPSSGRNTLNYACVAGSDGVYVAAQGAEPVFTSTFSARLMLFPRLVLAMSHRDFDPKKFTWAGALYRAVSKPLSRDGRIGQIADRYRQRARVVASDDSLRAYASVEIAAAAGAAVLSSSSGSSARIYLRTRAFETAIGTFRFNEHGDPTGPVIVIQEL